MKQCLLLCIAVLTLNAFTPKKITWVAIGDSITYLNDHPDETGNRVSKGYMTRVVEQLPSVQYINQGHNGWTSGGVADKIDDLGIVKADVYSVFLGTNDWWQGRPVGTIEDYRQQTGNHTFYGSYAIIINKLKKLNPKARIILITPMQRVDFVYLNDYTNNAWGSYKDKNGQSLEKFATAIKSIASLEHFELVDLFNKTDLGLNKLVKYKRLKDPKAGVYKNYPYPSFINIPFNPAVDDYPYPIDAAGMTYDGLHPSDKGNAVIASMLLPLIKNLIGQE